MWRTKPSHHRQPSGNPSFVAYLFVIPQRKRRNLLLPLSLYFSCHPSPKAEDLLLPLLLPLS
jgi:hypothetical protein